VAFGTATSVYVVLRAVGSESFWTTEYVDVRETSVELNPAGVEPKKAILSGELRDEILGDSWELEHILDIAYISAHNNDPHTFSDTSPTGYFTGDQIDREMLCDSLLNIQI
jgi:hypothetical protein